jgi:hypothetical protein
MVSVTKRELFLGAAGLGIGLAAGSVAIAPLGTGDAWGPGPNPSSGGNFTPSSLCLVYMKFDRRDLDTEPDKFAPLFVARHIWFDAPAGNSNDHLKFALEKFKEMLGLLPPPNNIPNWPPSGGKRPSEGFVNFNFGGRSRIYFYIEDQPDVSFDEQNLIQFTKYSADHLPNGGRKQMDKNKSFPPAEIIERGVTGLPGKILYLENRFKKHRLESLELGEEDIVNPVGGPSDDPTKPKKPFLEYSMNIHLRMKMPDGSTIPLVIDPIPRNGGGWAP